MHVTAYVRYASASLAMRAVMRAVCTMGRPPWVKQHGLMACCGWPAVWLGWMRLVIVWTA